MHAYYTQCEWLPDDEIAEVLPEDGMPASLVIHDLEGDENTGGITKSDFQDWLWEGRHDCEVAVALLRFWLTTLKLQ